MASIYETGGEIFGVDYRDNIYRENVFTSLVMNVLNELKAKGSQSMTFFTEDETQQAVLSIGFRFIGKYLLYYKGPGNKPENEPESESA